MTQVAISTTGANLRPDHAMTGVTLLNDVLDLDRFGETRPAAVAVELRLRGEEFLPTRRADVHALLVVQVERAAERPLGALLAQDVILGWRQLGPPLRLGLLHLVCHTLGV